MCIPVLEGPTTPHCSQWGLVLVRPQATPKNHAAARPLLPRWAGEGNGKEEARLGGGDGDSSTEQQHSPMKEHMECVTQCRDVIRCAGPPRLGSAVPASPPVSINPIRAWGGFVDPPRFGVPFCGDTAALVQPQDLTGPILPPASIPTGGSAVSPSPCPVSPPPCPCTTSIPTARSSMSPSSCPVSPPRSHCPVLKPWPHIPHTPPGPTGGARPSSPGGTRGQTPGQPRGQTPGQTRHHLGTARGAARRLRGDVVPVPAVPGSPLRTWLSRCGGVGMMVGLEDLRGLLQPSRFCGSPCRPAQCRSRARPVPAPTTVAASAAARHGSACICWRARASPSPGGAAGPRPRCTWCGNGFGKRSHLGCTPAPGPSPPSAPSPRHGTRRRPALHLRAVPQALQLHDQPGRALGRAHRPPALHRHPARHELQPQNPSAAPRVCPCRRHCRCRRRATGRVGQPTPPRPPLPSAPKHRDVPGSLAAPSNAPTLGTVSRTQDVPVVLGTGSQTCPRPLVRAGSSWCRWASGSRGAGGDGRVGNGNPPAPKRS